MRNITLDFVCLIHMKDAMAMVYIGMIHAELSKIYTLAVVEDKPANMVNALLMFSLHNLCNRLQIMWPTTEQPAMAAPFTGMIRAE